jgi:predicted transcriptional regulator
MLQPSPPIERQADERTDALKAAIAQGVADIAAGRVRELDTDEIKRRGRALLGLPTDCRRNRL